MLYLLKISLRNKDKTNSQMKDAKRAGGSRIEKCQRNTTKERKMILQRHLNFGNKWGATEATPSCGCEDGSGDKLLAAQVWGLEFGSSEPISKALSHTIIIPVLGVREQGSWDLGTTNKLWVQWEMLCIGYLSVLWQTPRPRQLIEGRAYRNYSFRGIRIHHGVAGTKEWSWALTSSSRHRKKERQIRNEQG